MCCVYRLGHWQAMSWTHTNLLCDVKIHNKTCEPQWQFFIAISAHCSQSSVRLSLKYQSVITLKWSLNFTLKNLKIYWKPNSCSLFTKWLLLWTNSNFSLVSHWFWSHKLCCVETREVAFFLHLTCIGHITPKSLSASLVYICWVYPMQQAY